jgi:hypothetical protein
MAVKIELHESIVKNNFSVHICRQYTKLYNENNSTFFIAYDWLLFFLYAQYVYAIHVESGSEKWEKIAHVEALERVFFSIAISQLEINQ